MNIVPSSHSRVDFVLITALPEERDAVLAKLPAYHKLPPTNEDIRTYFQADLPVTFPDSSVGKYRVVIMCLSGMGRVQAATATADAIRQWHPRYVMLIGIAGGIANRKVQIGDILISDQIVDYELQKVTSDGPEIRWEVERAEPRLLNACINYKDESWQQLISVRRPRRGKPTMHIGPIASGDKVIAFGKILTKYQDVWRKLLGVEMEAAGVATAVFQASDRPGFFMVRGVSALADDDKGSIRVVKWRSYACDVAAAFAVALLKSGPVPLIEETIPTRTRKVHVTLDDVNQKVDRMRNQSEQTPFKYDAFISYSHNDKTSVDRLIRRLRSDGFQLWIDEEQVGGGDPLRQVILKGITQSRHVIVCLSPDYLDSMWATFESIVNHAMDADNRVRRVIPVRIAAVEIPLEYRPLYCPDLTQGSTWEQEYQKTIKNLRSPQENSDFIDGSPVPVPDEQLSDGMFVPPQPQPPDPTPRLARMGFRFHPFEWQDAERMSLDVLEETYTPHAQFNETVMNLERSTALLAPFGGGKSAGRRQLMASLLRKQREIIRERTRDSRTGNVPLVAQYTDFERLYSELPEIRIENHQPFLLACIADSVSEFICTYPDLFMSLNQQERDFWWAFLDGYRLGIQLASSLRDQTLLKDYQRVFSRPNPFIPGTSLAKILRLLVEQLKRLNIQTLIILVDGVDAQAQTPMDMEALASPLFQHLGILSIPDVIWKFFLPDVLENMVLRSSSYKTGRVKMLPIQWNQDNLKLFLIGRLLWASEGSISDIAQHCDQNLITEGGDLTMELARIAINHEHLGSPRAMLDLANKLYHQGSQEQITLKDWNMFLETYGLDKSAAAK